MKLYSLIIAIIFFSLSAYSQKDKNNQLGSAPGSYKIKNKAKSVEIPFKIDKMEIMIDAEMNGKKIKFIIDNGVMWDQLLFFGSSLVDSLGMIANKDENAIISGAGDEGSSQSTIASNVTISFSDITFYNQEAIITDKKSGFAEMWPGIAGQVCGALFKHFVVEFNFDKQIITLHKPENFVYTRKGKAIKMTRNSVGSYSIPITINQNGKKDIESSLFIDIGTDVPIMIAINEKDGILKPEGALKKVLGYGTSGDINGYEGFLNSIKLSDYSLTNVKTDFIDKKADHTTCTIGLPLLMRFNLFFDYFNEVLYIEPNSNFNKP